MFETQKIKNKYTDTGGSFSRQTIQIFKMKVLGKSKLIKHNSITFLRSITRIDLSSLNSEQNFWWNKTKFTEACKCYQKNTVF